MVRNLKESKLKRLIDYWEILGDVFLIAFGVLLVYLFVTIEVFHIYGVEANSVVGRFELVGGILIIGFGVFHFIRDWKTR